jgi:hypothetical protein
LVINLMTRCDKVQEVQSKESFGLTQREVTAEAGFSMLPVKKRLKCAIDCMNGDF